jgi:hypothetical protein
MRNAEQLRIEAERCRRLARDVDAATAHTLIELAQNYEAEVRRLASDPPRPE